MTTLAILKAEIADDLDRTDLTTAIASEITKAIRYYQIKRFYFNETRDVTFSTVASQKLYSSSDNASIPKFIELDQVFLTEGTDVSELDRITPKDWESWTASGDPENRPTDFTVYNKSLGLHPIPDAAYTIRPVGLIQIDAPATDDEANNPWMVEGAELIRARVCYKLALRKIRDLELAATNKADEADEFQRLLDETASRLGTGFIRPTEF